MRTIGSSSVAVACVALFCVLLSAQGDTQPPTVTFQSPPPGATNVAVNVTLRATFSEPVQATSISMTLRTASNAVVPATVSYDDPTRTASLVPAAALTGNATYTVTVTGARDLAGNVMVGSTIWSFSTATTGFRESIVFSGLTLPTAVEFASDGRVFVAEKSGLIKVFASLSATTPTVFADLRTKVYDWGDRGLLGIVLDPQQPA